MQLQATTIDCLPVCHPACVPAHHRLLSPGLVQEVGHAELEGLQWHREGRASRGVFAARHKLQMPPEGAGKTFSVRAALVREGPACHRQTYSTAYIRQCHYCLLNSLACQIDCHHISAR